MSTNIPFTDLTQRPPRSPHVRLGGLAILPRILDKGRAKLAGKNGDYVYAASTDKHLLNFLGLDPDALLKELATGKGDGEILTWVTANSKNQRAPWEIEAWSAFFDRRGPDSDVETLNMFAEKIGGLNANREDVKTWFAAIDLDDYVSFGGKA